MVVHRSGIWLMALAIAGLLGPACATTPTKFVIVGLLTPNAGAAGAATDVTITGSGFKPGALVSFGGAPATSVTVLDDSTIQLKTPTFVEGTVDVVVRNSDGSSATLRNGFTFQGAIPVTVLSVTPADGRAGFNLTVTGTAFKPGAVVTFDDVPAALTTVTSGGSLFASVPILTSGTFAVTVRNLDGTSGTRPTAFTYHGVTLASSTAPVNAGTPVTISWVAPFWQQFAFSADEWIGLFPIGAPIQTGSAVWWTFVQSETGSLTLVAPSQPGQYQFRYVSGNTVQTVAGLTVF